MQLSPLQSRLAASISASLLLLLLYLSLFSPHLALAHELLYSPEFESIDHGVLDTMPPEIAPLDNNVPQRISIAPGRTVYFAYESLESHRSIQLEGEHDHMPHAVFVTANTCQHPDIESASSAWSPAPQLGLTISAKNPNDLALSEGLATVTVEFSQGAVMHRVPSTDAVYLAITAPSLLPGFSGMYTVEIAVSVDDWFHRYQVDDSPHLTLLATDSSTALLRTRDLGINEPPDDLSALQHALQDDPPYILFAAKESSTLLHGVRRSICGLRRYAPINSVGGDMNAVTATTSIIGPGRIGQPGHRFHLKGLDAGSQYTGILVHTGRRGIMKRLLGQIGGGGHVFQPRALNTSQSDNCRVITGLKFCHDVDYAVPANMVNFTSLESLAAWYDQNAQAFFQRFTYNMMQIPCEVTVEQQYSTVRTCSDCINAYKTWLCAVAVPRCEEFNSNNPFAISRNVGQAFPNKTMLSASVISSFTDPAFKSSRIPMIDLQIAPGPYKEILPCDDLCYNVAQSCPASLGLTCPLPGQIGYNGSYARRLNDSLHGLSCNAAGPSQISGANGLMLRNWWMISLVGCGLVSILFAL